MIHMSQPVAIITGASSGIGREIARLLVRRGYRVALAARRPEPLHRLAGELGAVALARPTDVTDSADTRRLADEVLDRWGQIDVLVAAAGEYVRSSVTELSVSDVERSMAVNFYGVLNSILAVLPHMVDRRQGRMVLVASVDGRKGLLLDAPYAAAKFAVVGLGDVARQELSSHGIAVTTVLPGRVDTPMLAGMRFPLISRPISPRRTARAVVRAMERERAEVVVPAKDRSLILLNALSPRLADLAVRRLRLEGWPAEIRL